MPKARHDRSVTRRIGAAAAVAGVMALALSGCVGAPAPTPTPTASASAEPVFASDEEALAAAVDAYSEYLAHVDASAAAAQPANSGLEHVVSPTHLTEVQESLKRIRERGLTPTGETKFDSLSIAQRDESETSGAWVDVYLCLDVGDVRVIDSSGNDITPASRDDRSPMQVQFVSSTESPARLIVNAEDPWAGTDFC